MQHSPMIPANTSRGLAHSLLLGWMALFSVAAAAPLDLSLLPPPARQQVRFTEDIQPLLKERCYQCHGPEKQRNNFRLDRKADALKGGNDFTPAIILGKSAESPLI